MAQRFCAIYHQDGTSEETEEHVDNGIDEMASQMNNYSSYSYSAYGPWDHYVEAGFTHFGSEADYDYYGGFASDLKTAYNKGWLTIEDGDSWILIDDQPGYGYGGTSDYNPWDLHMDDGSSYEVFLGRALDVEGDDSTAYGYSPDPPPITGLFTMHETGHFFGCHHVDGDYDVKEGERYNVTPMALSYICDDNDTCFDPTTNGGFKPVQACNQNNRPCDGGTWCGGCTDMCRHTSSMTGGKCDDYDSNNQYRSTKEKIHDRTPLQFYK